MITRCQRINDISGLDLIWNPTNVSGIHFTNHGHIVDTLSADIYYYTDEPCVTLPQRNECTIIIQPREMWFKHAHRGAPYMSYRVRTGPCWRLLNMYGSETITKYTPCAAGRKYEVVISEYIFEIQSEF